MSADPCLGEMPDVPDDPDRWADVILFVLMVAAWVMLFFAALALLQWL